MCFVSKGVFFSNDNLDNYLIPYFVVKLICSKIKDQKWVITLYLSPDFCNKKCSNDKILFVSFVMEKLGIIN